MKIQELSEGERPREKMLRNGTKGMSDAELMAILLRTGTSRCNVLEMSQRMLSEHGGKLSAVASLSVDELCRTNGLGKAKAVALCAAFELGRRSLSESRAGTMTVTGSETAASVMLGRLKGLEHEECWAMFLNRSNRILSQEQISSGGMFETVIDIRTVTRMALGKRASAVILFHNHPSGNPLPGKSDISQTDKLRKALATLDISLMDHIIIGSESYFSFADDEATPYGKITGHSSV